jgi:beta-lactam-binding protein with PASTA domain
MALLAVIAALAILYVLADKVIMPSYTRHNAAVYVPETRGLPFDQASAVLARNNLEARVSAKRHLPDVPRDAVISQDPPPSTPVKPGRHVYLVVNSGDIPLVEVPDLRDMSVRQARNSLLSANLAPGAVLEDSLPSPFRNTITRHDPAAGDSVAAGTHVTMWISTGLGSAIRQVPDVTGLTVEEARTILSSFGLRLVVLDDPSVELEPDVIERTSPEPGTEVPEGSEIRAFARLSVTRG